jgi:hypothetical protein
MCPNHRAGIHTGDFFHLLPGLPVTMVMQPTQHSNPANRAAPLPKLTRLWDLLPYSLMRPSTVVEGDVLLKNRLDLSSANKQNIVQRFSSQRSEEPFHNTVHVRGFHTAPARRDKACMRWTRDQTVHPRSTSIVRSRVPRQDPILRTTDFFCLNAGRNCRKETSLAGKLAELICNRKSQITTLSLHSCGEGAALATL